MNGSPESRLTAALAVLASILLLGSTGLLAAEGGTGCDWQSGDLHTMHWPQLPDFGTTGSSVSLAGAVLADDFLCTSTGYIREVHLWASFVDDRAPKEGSDALTVELRIYADSPAIGQQGSQPGGLLWTQTFGPGQYTAQEVHDGPEDWYDPASEIHLPDNHRKAYRYSFCIASNPFYQQERNTYWLAVRVASSSVNYSLGWATTPRRQRWNGDAMCLPTGQFAWTPMAYPRNHRYVDEPVGLAFVLASGDETAGAHELGDAPDSSSSFPAKMQAYPGGVGSNFPTVYQAGSPPHGPLHRQPLDGFYLGTWVSLESEADLGPDDDAVNNLDPRSDTADRDGADDGLHLPVVMPHCRPTTLDYTVTVTGVLIRQAYVNVWCDWNRDGDWDDTITCPDGTIVAEWAVRNELAFLPGPGTYTLTTPSFACWHPDFQDAPDPLWMRVTVSEQSPAWSPGGAGPAGGYLYGETEDYYIHPLTAAGTVWHDWGDAPDNWGARGYPTLFVNDGARHIIAGPWLGTADEKPDAEANGQPDAGASGDDVAGADDEEGVSIPPLIQGQLASITVSVQGGGGVVQGWIDFNGDQAWDNSEGVFDGFLPNGVHIVSLVVPENATVGPTFARFRISRGGGLDPHGPAQDGEVEDHAVSISLPPADRKWCQWPDCTPRGIDIRADGTTAQPRALADDFECRSTDKLTHIRLWGSWKDDVKGHIESIRVRIHADDPAGPAGADTRNPFAKPRPEILWEKQFVSGQYQESLYHTAAIVGGWWWDAASGELIPGGDSEIWQIDLDVDPADAFLQEGSAQYPRIYWLAVEVQTTGGQFGWKTRQWPEHSVSDAVWDMGSKLPRPWQELRYPEGHPCYDVETNSVDLAFCLMYTSDGSSQPTSRPTSVTQCPVVETMCPTTETKCPSTVTHCPVTETTCPVTSTSCPAMSTRCPSVATQCPTGVTACPAVETQCPAAETKCPASVTQCPSVETQCPMTATTCQTVPTTCPAVETHCPATETKCPASVTRCPNVETSCPSTSTWCPALETLCPAVETKCPLTETTCEAKATTCPAVETQCPTGATQCPAVATRCPATSTQCPVAVTSCPVSETKCPATETKCPVLKTKCPTTATQCPIVVTQCPTCRAVLTDEATHVAAAEPCPVVEARCLTVADYLAAAGTSR